MTTALEDAKKYIETWRKENRVWLYDGRMNCTDVVRLVASLSHTGEAVAWRYLAPELGEGEYWLTHQIECVPEGRVAEPLFTHPSPRPVERKTQWSDWIPWSGGECPIPWAKAPDYGIRLNDNREHTSCKRIDALVWEWRHVQSGINITAYRYRLDRAPDGGES